MDCSYVRVGRNLIYITRPATNYSRRHKSTLLLMVGFSVWFFILVTIVPSISTANYKSQSHAVEEKSFFISLRLC